MNKIVIVLGAMLMLICGAIHATPVTSGLLLWLDATDGSTLYQDAAMTTLITADGQTLGTWADKSGNANNYKYLGGTGWQEAVYATNAIGGNASFDFNESNYSDTTGDGGLYEIGDADDRTIFIVMKKTAAESGHQIMGPWDSGGEFVDVHSYNGGGDLRIRNNPAGIDEYSTPNTVPGNLDLILVAQGGSGATMSQIIDTNNASFDWDMTKMSIGGASAASLGYKGQIGEVLIYEEKLNQSDRDLVTAYLSTKWNIPRSPEWNTHCDSVGSASLV